VSEWKVNHVIFGFLAGVIISFVLLLSPFTSNEPVYMLIIFNFIFVSLTFPLIGTLKKKLFLLFLGNVIGLLWNHLFYLLAQSVVHGFGQFFNTLCIILNPFLNLVWIVSFWTLSLTAFTDSKNKKVVSKLDS
jgi:hypothetical protein